jgi:hypothetical protein
VTCDYDIIEEGSHDGDEIEASHDGGVYRVHHETPPSTLSHSGPSPTKTHIKPLVIIWGHPSSTLLSWLLSVGVLCHVLPGNDISLWVLLFLFL